MKSLRSAAATSRASPFATSRAIAASAPARASSRARATASAVARSEPGLRGGQLAGEFALGPLRELRPDPIKTRLGAPPGRILTLGRGRVLLGAEAGEELVDASVEPAEGPLDLGAALAPPPLELGGKRIAGRPASRLAATASAASRDSPTAAEWS